MCVPFWACRTPFVLCVSFMFQSRDSIFISAIAQTLALNFESVVTLLLSQSSHHFSIVIDCFAKVVARISLIPRCILCSVTLPLTKKKKKRKTLVIYFSTLNLGRLYYTGFDKKWRTFCITILLEYLTKVRENKNYPAEHCLNYQPTELWDDKS